MQEELRKTLALIVSQNKTISFKDAFIKTCIIAKILPDDELVEDSKIIFDNIKATTN